MYGCGGDRDGGGGDLYMYGGGGGDEDGGVETYKHRVVVEREIAEVVAMEMVEVVMETYKHMEVEAMEMEEVGIYINKVVGATCECMVVAGMHVYKVYLQLRWWLSSKTPLRRQGSTLGATSLEISFSVALSGAENL